MFLNQAVPEEGTKLFGALLGYWHKAEEPAKSCPPAPTVLLPAAHLGDVPVQIGPQPLHFSTNFSWPHLEVHLYLHRAYK